MLLCHAASERGVGLKGEQVLVGAGTGSFPCCRAPHSVGFRVYTNGGHTNVSCLLLMETSLSNKTLTGGYNGPHL